MKIKIKHKLKEISSMSNGSVEGYGAPFGDKQSVDAFNKKQEREQRLKGSKLTEAYSTQGSAGINKQQIVDPEEEHAGHVERSEQQGLKNVMEADDSTQTVSMDDEKTKISPLGSELQDLPKKAMMAVQKAGFKFVGYLGGGQFGKVFKVENTQTGMEQAMKIVMGTQNSVDREVRNYELVQKARETSPVLEKHFPETYASWQQDGFGFIAMEILEPLANPADALVIDRYNILSKDSGDELRDKEVERGNPEKFKDYKDQSKKSSLWFENVFIDSLKGTGEQIEQFALEGLKNLPELDTDEQLIRISPTSMRALKTMYETNNPTFYDKLEKHVDFFYDRSSKMPKISKLLDTVLGENKEAPFVAVALGAMAHSMFEIREKGMKAANLGEIDYQRFDMKVAHILLQYVKSYREFSTMRLGYDRSGQNVEVGSINETWDKIARELYDKTGLAARDVHYGNVMQRPDGDLVIVDLGLFKMKGDKAGMFETKKYKLKILRNR